MWHIKENTWYSSSGGLAYSSLIANMWTSYLILIEGVWIIYSLNKTKWNVHVLHVWKHVQVLHHHNHKIYIDCNWLINVNSIMKMQIEIYIFCSYLNNLMACIRWLHHNTWRYSLSHGIAPSVIIHEEQWMSCIISYSKWHCLLFFFGWIGIITALTASSKTDLSPLCVFAEHSTYLTAPTLFAIASPWLYETNAGLLSEFSLFTVSLSSRRSILFPTSIVGVSGQWCRISGYHWNHSK